jgi:hypothetical protein
MLVVMLSGCQTFDKIKDWWEDQQEPTPAPVPEPTLVPVPEPVPEPVPPVPDPVVEPDSSVVPEKLVGHYYGNTCVLDDWRPVFHPIMIFQTPEDAIAQVNGVCLTAIQNGTFTIGKALQRTTLFVQIYNVATGPSVYRAITIR